MATYYVWSGATGLADGTSWTDAYTDLDTVFTSQTIIANDVIRLADDHDNTSYVSSKTWAIESGQYAAGDPFYLISTNRGTGLPSVGAIEQTGGNYAMTLRYKPVCYGITFKVGSGISESTADISLGVVENYGNLIFHKCNFVINSTSSGALISVASSISSNNVIFNECDFSFGHSGQYFNCAGACLNLIKCTFSGTALTNLFNFGSYKTNFNISGCDLSSATNLFISGTGIAEGFIKNCVLPSSIDSSRPSYPNKAHMLEFHSCTSTDHNYHYKKQEVNGDINEDVAVYLTTGGSIATDTDGTEVKYSLKLETVGTTGLATVISPLYTPWFNFPVFSTGSKTFSIKVGHTEAAVLKDNECWMEIEYMGGSAPINTPLTETEITAPLVSGTILQDFLAAGSNLTDTAEAWTGIASEKTHTLSKTVTVDEQGYARARIALAKKSVTLYVNAAVAVA